MLRPRKSQGRQKLEALKYDLWKNSDTRADSEAEETAFALIDGWVVSRIQANRTERGFRLRLIAELQSALDQVRFWPMDARREGNHVAAKVYRRAWFRLVAWNDCVSRFQYVA